MTTPVHTRTRFAPSPTGFIHLGNIRSALYPWAFARATGGDFILRIEDTDLDRSTQASVDVIIEGMAWLGLAHDEGPFYQMQRMDRYKAVLADLIARAAVTPVFADPQAFSSLEILIATLAFTVQIYLDFSAYTDVVIGSARLLGLQLPENFDRPYQARSISEYWRRWHMSLSAWVGQYVYRPLGGNRVVRWKVYRNVMISIVLLALWHGLTPNFLLYGLLHGTAVCLNRWLREQPWWRAWAERHERAAPALGWTLTFAFVVMARILFKTPTFEDAQIYWHSLMYSELSAWPRFGLAFWACLGAGLVGCFMPASWTARAQHGFERLSPLLQGLLLAAVLMLGAWLSDGQALAFIYRQY
jgi:hypothetical protein